MENEMPLSPASSHGLLDFSGKFSMNNLGPDFLDDPTLSRYRNNNRSVQFDLSELNPKPSDLLSMDRSKLVYSSKPDFKPNQDQVFAAIPYDLEDDLDIKDDDVTPTGRSIRERHTAFEGMISDLRRSSSRGQSPAKSPSFIAKLKNERSLNRERSYSGKTLSTRKSRAGSMFSDRRISEMSSTKTVGGGGGGGMSIINLVAMARKMGLIKKNHAFEDYMSKEQFHMIKDLSTGKFDTKETKRSEQMIRLKKKLLLHTDAAVARRTMTKRAIKIDWKFNVVATVKRMYNQFWQRIQQTLAPNTTFCIVWDIFIIMIIVYDLCMVPLALAFDVPLTFALQVWDIIVTASFVFDIVLNFRTGYYDKGMLVMERKKIYSNYLKGWFWMDALTAFPYQNVISDSDIKEQEADSGNGSYQIIRVMKFFRYIKIIRLVRIIKLNKLYTKIESYIDFSTMGMGIIGFVRLCFINLLFAHWFACAWHFVSVWELESHPESWLTRANEVDAPLEDRYISSIYWATTTMITVGYGDIVPVTRNEKLLTVLAMLVAGGVFAYTMNRINLILAGFETSSEQYQKARATITDYMRKKRVKKELQIKIKKYLEYALEVETSLDSNEAYLNAYLNQSLKHELLLEIHGNILLENGVFMRFDNSLILKAAQILKEKIYSPEDPVFLENDNHDSSIYIIHSGKIEIFNFKSNSFLKGLTKGEYFGEIAFFTGQPRTASARSTDFSALYLIQRNEFLEILNEFPQEREKFNEVKDKLGLYQNQSVINIKCYSCGADDHLVNACPKVHSVISKQDYIKRYIEKRNKFMTSYMRSRPRSDKKIYNAVRLGEAARTIQIKIWEGEVEINKLSRHITGEIDSPLLPGLSVSEHPTTLASESRSRKIIPPNTAGDPLKRIKSNSADPKSRFFFQTLTSLDFDTGSSAPTEAQKRDLKKKNTIQITNTNTALLSPPKMRKGENKKQRKALLDDIDRVQNFEYYFPHNNFEVLCPQTLKRMRSGEFDYLVNNTKETLKKFIVLLRERVKQKKENAEKDNKDNTKRRRSSFFGKLVGSPLRSRFYKERQSIVMTPIDLPRRKSIMETPKNQEADSDSRSSDESP